MKFSSFRVSALIVLLFTALSFAVPSMASTPSDYAAAIHADHEMVYLIQVDDRFDYIATAADDIYAPPAWTWRLDAEKHELPIMRNMAKRQGLSYRKTRQPNVKGAPILI